ncbi:hypothetical protein NHQ30_000604 [Ciborinia camelliae]|nr:hypothetical protein NHQ30_000604 [Ciborinia camelliae]
MIDIDLNGVMTKKMNFGNAEAVLKKQAINGLRNRLRSAQINAYSEALERERYNIRKRLAKVHQGKMREVKATVSGSREAIGILGLKLHINSESRTKILA